VSEQPKGKQMAFRKKLSKSGSKRLFSKTSGTNSKNMKAAPMRGGTRL